MDDNPQKSVSSLRSRFEQIGTNVPPPTTPTPVRNVAVKPPPPPVPIRPQATGSNRHDRLDKLGSANQTPNKPAATQPLVNGTTELEPIRKEERTKSVGGTSSSSHLHIPTNSTPLRQRPLSVGNLLSANTPSVTVNSPRSPARTDNGPLPRHDPRSDRISPVPSPRESGSSSPSETPPPVSPRPQSYSSRPENYFHTTRSVPVSLQDSAEFGLSRRKAPLSTTMQALRDYPIKPSSDRQTPFADPIPPNTTTTPPSITRTLSDGPPPIPARPERASTVIDPTSTVRGFTRSQTDLLSSSSLGQGSQYESERSRPTKKSPFNTPPSSPSSDEGRSDLEAAVIPSRATKPVLDGTSPFAPPPTRHSILEQRNLRVPPPPPANPPKPRSKAMSETNSTAPSLRSDTMSQTSERSMPPPLDTNPRNTPYLSARYNTTTPIESPSDYSRASLLRGRSHSPTKSSPVIDMNDYALLPPKRIHSTLKTPSPNRPDSQYASSHHSHSQSMSQRSFSITSSYSAATTRTYMTDTSYAEDDNSDDGAPQSDPNDYPDSSGANRRRPIFHNGPREINCKYDVKLFAVCGQFVCTSAHTTRVWNIRTGENIMTLHHGETARISAMAFKPSKNIKEEGSQLWLGTQTGELMEIDIPSQKILYSRTSAHTKKEVVKIHRHAYELWSLDDGGKLQVWPPDSSTGMPHLANTPRTLRIRAGHSYSLVAGNQLWVACGRDVNVYQPSADANVGFHLVDRPIAQLKQCGEITSGAIVNSIPDMVFLGHSDGKVSVYSTKSLTCIDVVSVSLYKINAMSGVGDYLWAGFQTGMVYVYDVTTRPWRVLKDWKAHERPVTDVIADRTSIWKIDRLQVVSLSADNIIKVWDGLLEEDWLEEEMQKHDVEFCTFRNIKTLVCTWNAGASKPQDLHNFRGDERFLEHVLTSVDSPDIIVFGFQELVDLENKKLTAKSIFKGKKSEKRLKEGDQEHMSRQYRLWQEHLSISIDRYLPTTDRYQLLHAANLVGLYTCIFIKSAERGKVRSINACSVKTGLGGLHGNKGALVIRFLLDDSSLCFINCHLAAGQGGTRNRNKDIADILESNNLSPESDHSVKTNSYIGGGDGSMILDHEICVLNGDLNYRIDHSHREGVINNVRNNELDKLLQRDQLLMERKKNPGFRLRSFLEEPITFAPTYKYDVGTDKYDSSEKKRIPSWCDRILYRGLGRIKQLDYVRHEVHTSDHRPVSASFMIKLKTVSRRKREEVLRLCEQKYQEIKQSHVYEAKLDFLVNVCGYPADQARATLDREVREAR